MLRVSLPSERRQRRSSAYDGPLLDEIDRRILIELQDDGRVTMAELGRRVNLSAPGGGRARAADGGERRHHRLRGRGRSAGDRLPDRGASSGSGPARRQLHKVPEVARSTPEVVECHRVTGEDCYIAKAPPAVDGRPRGDPRPLRRRRADDHVDRALRAGRAAAAAAARRRPTEAEAPHRPRCATIRAWRSLPGSRRSGRWCGPATAGSAVGALLVILAVTGAGLVLGLIGAIVLLVSGWATRALRDL